MNKQIFILNGTPRSGKDTFASLLNEYIPTKHISSITPVKKASETLGWSGEKTPEYRKFLCEFKKFLNSQGDTIWDYLDKEVDDFCKDDKTQILLIDIREPGEIKKAVERYGAKTILIVKHPTYSFDEIIEIWTRTNKIGNTADLEVDNYNYDYKISNLGTLQDFEAIVREFAAKIKPLKLQGKVIAVDFDNTIARTKYPEIIEPIYETIDLLRNLKSKGAKIILWTCREGEPLEAAVKWCKENDVPIDLVNENLKERSEYWGNDSRKIGADLYIDDKSFSLWHDCRNAIDIINGLLEDSIL